MKELENIALYNGTQIRKIWDENAEKWRFSVVDIITALTGTERPRKYWNDLKTKLISEGSELSDKIGQLKMVAEDGKRRETDVADTETIFRLIQSIPSPNAEPFKLWLAKVGYERVEETVDPEIAINRALNTYLKKGYDKNWINQRLKSIEIRKDLTDEWERGDVKKRKEFAILTDDITFAWAGLKTRDYKKLKKLKKENLRDNMTNLELVLTMLGETATTEISKEENPKELLKHRDVAKRGGSVAGNARKQIEKETKKKVVKERNNLGLKKIK